MGDFEKQILATIKRIRIAQNRNEVVDVLKESKGLANSMFDVDDVGSFFAVGEALLESANSAFVGYLTKKEYADLFLSTFLAAPPLDVLLLVETKLSRGVCCVVPTLDVVDGFIRKRIAIMLSHLCDVNRVDKCRSLFSSSCQALVALPSKVANVVKGDIPKCLADDNFTRSLAVALLESLETCHRMLMENVDCSLAFHSQLMGKLQTCGYSKDVLQILVPFLDKKCSSDDFIWRRIAQRFIVGVPRSALESLIAEIIQLSSNHNNDCLSRFLGDFALNDETIRFVLTKKLIFVRYFEDAKIPKTIFACLRRTTNGFTKIGEILVDLLDVWSCEFSTLNSPFQQHFYQSLAIIVASTCLRPEDVEIVRSNVMKSLLGGIPNHLNNPNERIRLIGMAVAEILTKMFALGESTLTFDYIDSPETTQLKKVALRTTLNEEEEDFDVDLVDFNEVKESVAADEELLSSKVVVDSDDDLEPYEMPDESAERIAPSDKTGKLKNPIYLRDCLNRLIEMKDYQHFESAFSTLEQLVLDESPGLSDMAVELSRILLHLEDKFAFDQFYEIRLRCLVAVCVKRPKEVAEFLTSTLYARNYCLQHRMDILEVLRMSAKELSGLTSSRSATTFSKDGPMVMSRRNTLPLWRDEVDRRLMEKTRRFSTKIKTGTSVAAPNRFSTLCAQFFYPLLANFDRPTDSTLDMLNRDFVVLVRLLYTAGSILLYAENCPDSIGMAACIIEFVWGLRKHREAMVRQGVMFGLTSAFLCVSPRVLANNFNDSLMEVKFWLEDEATSDVDRQCTELAATTLNVLNRQMHEGLNSMIEIVTR